MITNAEIADIHLTYKIAHCNAQTAKQMYRKQGVLYGQILINIHR